MRITARQLRTGAWILGALPAAALALVALGPGLGADPVGTAIRRTGDAALVLLLLSLAPGALRGLTRSSVLMPVRRPLGLAAFAYACLHLAAYLGLGYGLNLSLAVASLAGNRFVWLGLATWALMTPLAITSTAAWRRRLGRRWALLHRLVYLAALLDAWHYAWVAKELRGWPILALAAAGALLLARLPWRALRRRPR